MRFERGRSGNPGGRPKEYGENESTRVATATKAAVARA
jgi:hypothetical protein